MNTRSYKPQIEQFRSKTCNSVASSNVCIQERLRGTEKGHITILGHLALPHINLIKSPKGVPYSEVSLWALVLFQRNIVLGVLYGLG